MLPGDSGQLSVVRWTAPAEGNWDVVGQFFGTGATTADVHVLRNSSSIFDSPLSGSDVQKFSLTLNLKPGETIDFAVGVGADGSNSFDSTGFKAVIAPHAFTFTTIDFPGTTRTRLTGLNDHGDVVGDYRDSAGVLHGILLSQGAFTTFDPPGSILTRGIAINNLGVIGGHFLDSSNTRHSYLLSRGNFTTIDVPGAAQGTVAGGINDLGQIVGNFGDAAGNGHGFLLSAGKLTTIDFPGAFSMTIPFGINSSGEIVGWYDDSNGILHSFTLRAGNFSTVDFPNSSGTRAIRANEAGQIVGSYFSSGEHGFLATPSR